mmetsp:Transcript_114191/g.323388  ORF Transcript_114191/g.323388 Transcript_114191/m.323388 type:complete len:204 (+) Transcript_114191:391-1002(+)
MRRSHELGASVTGLASGCFCGVIQCRGIDDTARRGETGSSQAFTGVGGDGARAGSATAHSCWAHGAPGGTTCAWGTPNAGGLSPRAVECRRIGAGAGCDGGRWQGFSEDRGERLRILQETDNAGLTALCVATMCTVLPNTSGPPPAAGGGDAARGRGAPCWPTPSGALNGGAEATAALGGADISGAGAPTWWRQCGLTGDVCA